MYVWCVFFLVLQHRWFQSQLHVYALVHFLSLWLVTLLENNDMTQHVVVLCRCVIHRKYTRPYMLLFCNTFTNKSLFCSIFSEKWKQILQTWTEQTNPTIS